MSERPRFAVRATVDTVRRRCSMLADQALARAWKRFGPGLRSVALDDDPRLALITVNFSTTWYLKLLLLTLAEQHDRGLLHRVVVVDNASRDGGAELLRRLSAAIPRLHLVERRHHLSHGAGMRAGLRALDRVEPDNDPRANVVLFCDTDVILRSPDAMASVAGTVLAHSPALVGEVRSGVNPHPDIQASFFAVRRDVLADRRIAPPVHDGSPAYRLQRSIWDASLPVVDLPSNHGGLVLHRGRAGVEAAGHHRPRHQYATVRRAAPHYMGVPSGAAIWAAVEADHAMLLDPSAEGALVAHLADRLAVLGTARIHDA